MMVTPQVAPRRKVPHAYAPGSSSGRGQKYICILVSLFVILYMFAHNHTKENNSQIKERLEYILNKHSLEPWYPRIIDKVNDGYYSNFESDWQKSDEQDKFIVTQARHVWTLSKAYEFYPERTQYKEFARHGYLFLKEHMWDKEFGGFYELADSTGQVVDGPYNLEKRAYGNAFAIFALAAFYKVSNDIEVLELVIKAFNWFDQHAHDEQNGGYYQYLNRDGSPIPRSVLEEEYNGSDPSHVGLKDYNSSIHILEAFAELYSVWPDESVKKRLQEMFEVLSETMYDPRGFLRLYFYADWTLVRDEDMEPLMGKESKLSNHVTFGHDVETAFLLLEAAKALRMEEDDIMPKAKLFVDHALAKGWDNKAGGFYDIGKYIDNDMSILHEGKNWWAQSEGLNSLLLMHTYFPEDPNNYYDKFELQLSYIENYLLDPDHMGWYNFGVDHNPEFKTRRKAHIWKGNYHSVRALMQSIKMHEIGTH